MIVLLIIPVSLSGAAPEKIIVVGDRSYAPFEFQLASGQPRGIFVDIWGLWSKKTGIEVEYRLMDWSQALQAVREGKAQAIGGMSYSAERAKNFDFGESYYRVPANIFFHRNILGIKGLEDLKGFKVGVVKDDYAVTYIKEHQPGQDLLEFGTYEELIKGAVTGKVRVFITDTPVALFLLAKSGKDREFKYNREPLYTGEFRAAVKKGNASLLAILKAGFAAITPGETEQIDSKWLGRGFADRIPWRLVGLGSLVLMGLIAMVALWYLIMKRRVARATADLRAQHQALEESAKQVRRSEEFFRKFAELTDDCIMRFDRDFRHIYVNEVAERQTGIPVEAYLGKTHAEMDFPPDLVEMWESGIRKVFETGEHLRLEFELPSHVWIDWLLFPEKSADGKVESVMTSARDVTQPKKAERERAQLEEQLRLSQKMEAVGTLAGGIAHDFNNILQVISGCLQLLGRRGRLEESDQELLVQMENSVERASDMVKQLLAFSREMDAEAKPVNLNNEIEQAVKMLERTLPKMISIETDLADDLKNIKGNPTQIGQVLINLGANAADAMPQGGVLSFQTRMVFLDQVFCRQNPKAPFGPSVKLTVSDTGHGMDRETALQIFDPFFSTKEVGKGTGLGLAVVYGIVKGHRGYIVCKSRPGLGTSFEIYFPAVEKAEDAGSVEDKSLSSIPGGKETVLLVDDEKAILDTTSELLQEKGYKTLCATSGEEALDLYHKEGSGIDLVILDLGMPGMGGGNCLCELRKMDPSLKAIIASGYLKPVKIKGEQDALAEAYLAKPYKISDLLQTIREALDGQAEA